MLKMGWIISHYTCQTGSIWFTAERDCKQDCCHSNIKICICGTFLSEQRACQIPIVLRHYLQRYSLLCVSTSILSHLMTSSVPNLHNTKILNFSGTRWDNITTKRKTPFFFTFQGLSNSPIFQYLNFSFHRHFKTACAYSWFSPFMWSKLKL